MPDTLGSKLSVDSARRELSFSRSDLESVEDLEPRDEGKAFETLGELLRIDTVLVRQRGVVLLDRNERREMLEKIGIPAVREWILNIW